MADQKYDVIVIGGGVVGAAAAWKLAKAGSKTALIEKNEIGAGASSTNPGFCVLSYRENPLVMDLALRQQEGWDALCEEIGDIEYRPSGGLIPITDDAQLGVIEGLIKDVQKMGLKDIGIVTPEKAVELEPALDPSILKAACWCPGEGMLNPFRLNTLMADRAASLGADIFAHTEATGFDITDGVVTAVETNNGRMTADLIVLCPGAWTRDLASLAGIDLPVFYERGEAMVSMPVRPTVKRIITDGALFVQQISDEHPMTIGCCMGQTQTGNIVIAQSTTRPGNYDKSNTFEGLHGVAKRAFSLFPSLGDLTIIRMWAGLVSFAADHDPVFGPFAGRKNLFIVNSFHSAIALAPSLGQMVADYWQKGVIPEAAKAYTPDRFL